MKMVSKKDIRPQILGINTVIDKSIEEDFQNNTLRQIIKLQHDLIVAYFKEYLQSKKIRFDEISNLAYQSKSQKIKILQKSGKVVDIAKASDQFSIKALSKTVTKYYICYPKE